MGIMDRLKGKVALITGADSGIGQATAIAFASEGGDVIVCYRTDREGAESTLEEIRKVGTNGLVLPVDISEESQVEKLFDEASATYPSIDILVNNAAVNGQGIPVAEMSTEGFDRTIRVNLYGTFFCCRRFIKHRRQNGGKGKIINVSSVHEEITMPGAADYNASKGAVRNLTRTLAMELAEEGINVNNIAPGMILTPMNQKAVDDESYRKERVQHIPMKRAGLPEEIAQVAVFLASPESDYVTGSSYFMDGGLTLNVGQGA